MKSTRFQGLIDMRILMAYSVKPYSYAFPTGSQKVISMELQMVNLNIGGAAPARSTATKKQI